MPYQDTSIHLDHISITTMQQRKRLLRVDYQFRTESHLLLSYYCLILYTHKHCRNIFIHAFYSCMYFIYQGLYYVEYNAVFSR